MGLLVCACGGNEERMQDLAKKMNAEVVCVQKCKQAADVKEVKEGIKKELN